MKRKMKSSLAFKALLLAGLLAAPMLASNAMAADNVWSPLDTFTDGSGNQYAYFNDPNNWALAAVPTNGDGNRVIINGTLGTPGTYVTCVITNSMGDLYQLIMGDNGTAGGGNLMITNGAQVSFGVASGQWTGVGFPNGPSTLYIGKGCSFTCGSHLWCGQGTNNGNPAQGIVIVDGGSLYIPNGQLGIGWNGTGGTNYINLTNGARIYLQQWAAPTLGQPGNNSVGIMDIRDNQSQVIITNNYANDFAQLESSNQLIAYDGHGTIQVSFNPVNGLTTLSALPPTNQYTPVFSQQPANVVTSLGGNASFSVTVANGPDTYQWLFNGNPLTDGGGISGSKTANLSITGVTTAEIGSYSVIATNTVQLDQYRLSASASLSASGINFYPVVTIRGVPSDTYVTSYSTTVNGTYIPFATNTVGSFAPFYVVDTNSPNSNTRFYKTAQQ